MSIARVIVDKPLFCHFDYWVDDSLDPSVGAMVLVPFGTRQIIGIIMELTDQSELSPHQIKPIISLLKDRPSLPGEWLELLNFCAKYYQYPLGAAAFSILPPALKKLRLPQQRQLDENIVYQWTGPENVELPKNAPQQKAFIETCQNRQIFTAEEAKTWAKSAAKYLSLLVSKEWLKKIPAGPSNPIWVTSKAPYTLKPFQVQAIEYLKQNLQTFQVTLLHGITGSGKTEVYLQVIEAVLKSKQQALVLVPEINLTPQTEQRFTSRFPGRCILTLHSNMTESKRLHHWLEAGLGNADVILGTRSAVFTPMPKLGVIIVDEEHDSAYKQFDGMGYHARDLAIWRGKQRNIPVILGSATPSFESYIHAKNHRYHYLSMLERANSHSQLPVVTLIDLNHHKPIDGFSAPAIERIDSTLEKKEQVLIFLNRRGYAPLVYCPNCDWKALCPACDLKMVYHRVTKSIHCHHCGYRARPPKVCPDCGNQDMTPMGVGTQRLETKLSAQFPNATILRIDRDTTSTRSAFKNMHEAIQTGEADILIGTQMLAKGHDFPNLTLVIIVDADQALYSADYRATERLFSVLMQVSGRAGRGKKPGQVFIQTRHPQHHIYQSLLDQDYVKFTENLLTERKNAGFPPFGFHAILRAEADQLDEAIRFLRQVAKTPLRADFPDVFCYDPVPMLIAKKAYRSRAQLLVESASRAHLQQFLQKWRTEISTLKTKVHWRFDVDPFEF